MAIKVISDSVVSVDSLKFSTESHQVYTGEALETVTKVAPLGRAKKGTRPMVAWVIKDGKAVVFSDYPMDFDDIKAYMCGGLSGQGFNIRRIPTTDIADALQLIKVMSR